MNEPIVVASIASPEGFSERVRVCEREGRFHLHAGTGHFMLRCPPDASLEEALIAALEHTHTGLRVAAAGALGDLGTPRAVEPLRALAQRAARDSFLQRRVALQAVADIQSRLKGAAPGQLTVSGGAGGEISLARDGGGVSLT